MANGEHREAPLTLEASLARPVCPASKEPCAEAQACDFAEPRVRNPHSGLDFPAGLGRTRCARWVEAQRAEGRRLAEATVDPRAADSLEEARPS